MYIWGYSHILDETNQPTPIPQSEMATIWLGEGWAWTMSTLEYVAFLIQWRYIVNYQLSERACFVLPFIFDWKINSQSLARNPNTLIETGRSVDDLRSATLPSRTQLHFFFPILQTRIFHFGIFIWDYHYFADVHIYGSISPGRRKGSKCGISFIFWSSAVTKVFDFFNFSQLFWRDFAHWILKMFSFWS